MPGFNLKSIRQVASAKIQVKDPATGDPTGVIFEKTQRAKRKKTLLPSPSAGRV